MTLILRNKFKSLRIKFNRYKTHMKYQLINSKFSTIRLFYLNSKFKSSKKKVINNNKILKKMTY